MNKIKRSMNIFISIGSAEDERLIKRMNEKGVDLSKSEVIKEERKEEVQKESKEEENDSDKENDELRLHLTIAPDEEKEVDYEILDRKYPIKEWKTECLGTKTTTDQVEHFEEINQNVVIRSNGQKRYFSTLMRVLSIFDREDLNAVYSTGLIIHMLVEKKYPLRKEVLMQMLKLKLESEEDSTMALELIRFIKKILAELELKNKINSKRLLVKEHQIRLMAGSLPKLYRSQLVGLLAEKMFDVIAEKTELLLKKDRVKRSRNDKSVWIHPLCVKEVEET
ncbi:hypothetical protein Tco_1113942 [Tanacetum coccineum]|uniref:Uncharacterized protein n=1 Tax=Tanacetum coccineum TaxID=301880 RepID=A0ABQ5ITW4_9ASTR